MKVYLSGPISHNPNYVRDFQAAEKEIRAMGQEPVNPIDKAAMFTSPLKYQDYIDIDLAVLKACDAIYMLGGWKKSKCSCLEYWYALAHEKIVMYQNAEDAK